ncbi:DUF3592 domain-containing protein [Streptomyces sp. NPDC005209]|uniref:DUF3592 domain-containing protein n=1 Tax=Streptomyces sp. NPDC005209 TaxID=3156715 RepID=UPI0033AB8CCC
MVNELMGVVVCGGVGIVLLGCAARDAVVVRRLRRDGIRTRGVVVDNVRVNDSDGPSWAPVIAFHDHLGHRVEFTTKIRGIGMGLPTGREVPVVYLGQNPQTARVAMWRHLVGPTVGMLFGATLFLGCGVLIAAMG